MKQHSEANDSGHQAAAIAESILLKTNDFCESSVEELIAKDTKFTQMLD